MIPLLLFLAAIGQTPQNTIRLELLPYTVQLPAGDAPDEKSALLCRPKSAKVYACEWAPIAPLNLEPAARPVPQKPDSTPLSPAKSDPNYDYPEGTMGLVGTLRPKVPVVAEGAETMKIADDKFVCTDGHITGPCEELRKSAPVDVPAIQKKRPECVIRTVIGCMDTVGSSCPCGQYENTPYWTCRDESRSLMESVDGKLHWCHKGPSQ